MLHNSYHVFIHIEHKQRTAEQ